MNKKAAAGVLLALLVAGAGGYLYLHFRTVPPVYYPAFSDVQLRTVALSSADCSSQGCTTNFRVSIPFPANRGETSVTYYADLIMLSNPSNSSAVVDSITALNMGGELAGVNTLKVYYFASYSDFNTDGTPAGTPPGFCQTTPPIGCTVFSGSHAIPPEGGNYLEIVAYESPGATQGALSLDMAVTWS